MTSSTSKPCSISLATAPMRTSNPFSPESRPTAPMTVRWGGIPRARFASSRPDRRVLVQIDAVLDHRAAIGGDPAGPALLSEGLGDADHGIIMGDAEAVDPVVEGDPARAHHAPTVEGRDQPHRPKSPEDQAQRVGLVVVAVPDGDPLAAADREQLCDDPPVPGPAIGDRDQRGAPGLGAAPQHLEAGVPGGVQVGADVPVSERPEVPRRVEDRLLGAAAGPADDPGIEDDRRFRDGRPAVPGYPGPIAGDRGVDDGHLGVVLVGAGPGRSFGRCGRDDSSHRGTATVGRPE